MTINSNWTNTSPSTARITSLGENFQVHNKGWDRLPKYSSRTDHPRTKLYKSIKMASSPYNEQPEEEGYLCIIQIKMIDIASI